jgi:hypothetical protein
MSYQYGLIADQFTAVIQRFSSLLQYIVGTFDTDAMINFSNATVTTEELCLLQPALQSNTPLIH